jgi:hypothetical protein
MASAQATELPDCWKVMGCSEEVRHSCPAYPDLGKECWKVTGTKCAQGRLEMESLSEKIVYCRNECEFYRNYISRVYH